MKKILKNKKGFTLIELLAVIVVLAIIMVIATTQVTDAMRSATKDSYIASYNTIVKEVKNRIALEAIGNSETITCNDGSDEASKKCSNVYELSSKDYYVTVEEVKNNNDVVTGYKITFNVPQSNNVYTGKFKNVTFSSDDSTCPVNATCTANSAKIVETINK